MKYWQIIYYTGEGEFETKEVLINDDQYKQVQKALNEGREFIILENKPTIKSKLIASMNDAGSIVSEYQRLGIKVDGLLMPVEKPKEISNGFRRADFVKASHEGYYAKMNWEHKNDCICKNAETTVGNH